MDGESGRIVSIEMGAPNAGLARSYLLRGVLVRLGVQVEGDRVR